MTRHENSGKLLSIIPDDDSTGIRFAGIFLSNHRILQLSALLFAFFVIAEIVGAFISGSLSLLGDASAMTVDVLTYLANMYAESLKSDVTNNNVHSSWALDIGVPLLAVITLLGVTGWITLQAVIVISDPSQDNDVPVEYLFGFSIVNLLIDIACNVFFFSRGFDVFYHSSYQAEANPDDRHIQLNINSSTYNSQITVDSLEQSDYLDDADNLSDSQLIVDERDNSDLNAMQRHQGTAYSSINMETNDKNLSNRSRTRWNLNMWSAFAHVSGDTVRTITVLTAASVSVATGLNSAVCDAWAAIICAFTIVGIAAVLLNELRKAGVSHDVPQRQ